MLKLQRALDRLARAIEKVAGVLMGVVTVLVVASAAGRYLFAFPLPDAFDLSRLLLAAAIAWGFA
jgi:TRAP-type C4-dicarboxylate transport system permease small subunit